jgi:hypothetical protein
VVGHLVRAEVRERAFQRVRERSAPGFVAGRAAVDGSGD